MKSKLGAVVLAAGKSKRFESDVPKVLHRLWGRPMVLWVLDTLANLPRSSVPAVVAVVVSPDSAVPAAVSAFDWPFEIKFAVQKSARGTGDAARVGVQKLGSVDEVVVCAGDAPLITPDVVASLVTARRRSRSSATVLTAVLDDAAAYGRIIRDSYGDLSAIVEAADASPEQLSVREVNASAYCFAAGPLKKCLKALSTDNASGELLLTDAIASLVATKSRVRAVVSEPEQVLGANRRGEFADLARILRERIISRHLSSGVSVVDPESTWIDADVEIGRGSTILPATLLEGETTIGCDSVIGPNTRIVDSSVGHNSEVTFSVVRSSEIGDECNVGPFASLRAGTVLARGAKAGTFVEMKQTDLGEGAKVPHLSYMGDATIGARSNVGAGTISCNYDGKDKHPTIIGDDVFIGSDTMLVAPVRLGDRSRTGAGSVVVADVPEDSIAYGVPARVRDKDQEPS